MRATERKEEEWMSEEEKESENETYWHKSRKKGQRNRRSRRESAEYEDESSDPEYFDPVENALRRESREREREREKYHTLHENIQSDNMHTGISLNNTSSVENFNDGVDDELYRSHIRPLLRASIHGQTSWIKSILDHLAHNAENATEIFSQISSSQSLSTVTPIAAIRMTNMHGRNSLHLSLLSGNTSTFKFIWERAFKELEERGREMNLDLRRRIQDYKCSTGGGRGKEWEARERDNTMRLHMLMKEQLMIEVRQEKGKGMKCA